MKIKQTLYLLSICFSTALTVSDLSLASNNQPPEEGEHEVNRSIKRRGSTVESKEQISSKKVKVSSKSTEIIDERDLKMSTQRDHANLFAKLHIKGDPLILCNIWDAGSAKAVEKGGALAIATGSWAVAAAHGMEDGEKLSFDVALSNLKEIVDSVALPVTFDIEAGYGTDPSEVADKVRQVIEGGAIGINFEDQIIGGEGLYQIKDQCERIKAIRKVATESSVPLFINARTDVFFKVNSAEYDNNLLSEAIERAKAYAESGADCLFVPGLQNLGLIKKICEQSPISVNIMVMGDTPSIAELGNVGVARVSRGPSAYIKLMESLTELSNQTQSTA